MYEDGQWKRVFQNEHLENKLNPHWPTARIPLGKLCNGDVYRPIRYVYLLYVFACLCVYMHKLL
jgi:hypothetical protein